MFGPPETWSNSTTLDLTPFDSSKAFVLLQNGQYDLEKTITSYCLIYSITFVSVSFDGTQATPPISAIITCSDLNYK